MGQSPGLAGALVVLFNHEAVEVHFIKVTARRFLVWREPRLCRYVGFRRCIEQAIVICTS